MIKTQALAFCLMCLLSVASPVNAAVITLQGFLGSGATAVLDYNFNDATDVFTFTLTNTSAVGGFITNLGLDIGNTLQLEALTHSSALPYQFTNAASSVPPPFGPSPVYPTDFAVFLVAQTVGIGVGQSVTMDWLLAMNGGGPVSGITGDTIARGIGVRFRGLPTTVAPNATDIAVFAQVPEPTTLALLATGIIALAFRRGRQ